MISSVGKFPNNILQLVKQWLHEKWRKIEIDNIRKTWFKEKQIGQVAKIASFKNICKDLKMLERYVVSLKRNIFR